MAQLFRLANHYPDAIKIYQNHLIKNPTLESEFQDVYGIFNKHYGLHHRWSIPATGILHPWLQKCGPGCLVLATTNGHPAEWIVVADGETMEERLEKMRITLWLCQNSYWKLPFIVDLPIKNAGFSVATLVYQRVSGSFCQTMFNNFSNTCWIEWPVGKV